ncbi:MAG: Hsp20/alpha crystallin family protein [Dyella sp.]
MYASRYFVWPASAFRPAFDQRLSAVQESSPAGSSWAPAVDIREESDRFVILADIPGIDPANIEVSMEKNVLSLSGQREAATLEDGSRLTRAERSHGPFQRRFVLPEGVDAEGITANGKHGVLEVSIPKKALAAPRRIEVGAAH